MKEKYEGRWVREKWIRRREFGWGGRNSLFWRCFWRNMSVDGLT
jgi:hypothetical protein